MAHSFPKNIKVTQEEVDLSIFLTMVNLTVQKYHCKIEDIDVDYPFIFISGPTEQSKYECALEAANLFEKYLIT